MSKYHFWGLGAVLLVGAFESTNANATSFSYIHPERLATLQAQANQQKPNNTLLPATLQLPVLKTSTVPVMNVEATIPLLPGNVSTLKAVDLDQDGIDELVIVGAGDGMTGSVLTIMKYNTDSKAYAIHRQRHFRNGLNIHPNNIWVQDNGEAFAISNDNGMQRLSFSTLELDVKTNNYLYSDKLLYVDIDGDSTKELVSYSYSSLSVIDPNTLAVTQTYYFNGHVIGIGKFDASGAAHVVTSNYNYNTQTNPYSVYKIQSGASSIIKSGTLPGSVQISTLADVNDDGLMDLILVTYSSSNYSYALTAYDVANNSSIWSTNSGSSVYELVAPTGKDRVYAREWDGMKIFNLNTGTQASIVQFNSYFYNTFLQFPKGIIDGSESVLRLHYGYNAQGLSIVDPVTQQSVASFNDKGSDVRLVKWIDVDNDGVQDLVSIQAKGYHDSALSPTVTVHDGASLDLKGRFLLTPSSPTASQSVDSTAFVKTAEGRYEAWFGTTEQYTHHLRGIDLQSGVRKTIPLSNYYGNSIRIAKASLKDNETRLIVLRGSDVQLVDTKTQQVLSTLPLGNLYFHSNMVLSTGKLSDGTDAVFISHMTAPWNASDFQAAAITTNNNQLQWQSPIEFGGESYGNLQYVPDNSDYQFVAWNRNGKLVGYNATDKKWAYIANGCQNGTGLLKAITATQVLMLCGEETALVSLDTSSMKWATEKLGFSAFSEHTVALLNDGDNKRLAIGGAMLKIASYTGDVKQPNASSLSVRTHWNTPITLSLPVSNPNPDRAFATTVVVNPGNGTLTVEDSAKAIVKYTPGPASLETVTAKYLVKNNYVESDVATLTIVKTNTTPVVSVGSVTVQAGQTVSINGLGTDADGDTLTWEVVEQPTKGSLSLSTTTGAMTYKANAGTSGPDSFSIRVKDGVSSSEAVKATITIEPEPKKSKGGSMPFWFFVLLLPFLAASRRHEAINNR